MASQYRGETCSQPGEYENRHYNLEQHVLHGSGVLLEAADYCMKMNPVEHLLLGHPYLRDTSIQGAQNLALSGKMCIFYLYLLPTLMRM